MTSGNAKYFCNEDFTKIENYDRAMADESQVWVLHHRLETHFSDGSERPANARISRKELIELGMYYNRPANELIYMTKSDHSKLHGRAIRGRKKNHYIMTEEHKRKISEANKGRKGGMKGKKMTEEAKRKISEAATKQWAKWRAEHDNSAEK